MGRLASITPRWHGQSLRDAREGVGVEEAIRHRVVQRVTGTAEPFAREGEDFPDLPVQAGAEAWRADIRLLEAPMRPCSRP